MEPPIDFLPTYKLAKNELTYIDKKDQAPSYCDRVLYKNNSNLAIETQSYRCLHDIHGSDHRPVALALSIKNFSQPTYYDLAMMTDT